MLKLKTQLDIVKYSLWVKKFTLGGPVPPSTPPSGNFFFTPGEYVTMSNNVFNFNFLGLLLTEILRWSQIYTREPYAPWTLPSGEIFVPKASTHNV